MTYNGTHFINYFNGQLDGSPIKTNLTEGSDVNISVGCNNGTGTYFNGSIDDLRIYNYSLSPQQILALYNNKTNTIVSQELSTDDVWRCEVTPFSNLIAGDLYVSNNLTIKSLCDIYSSVTFTNRNLVCDIFRVWTSAVDVVFDNSTLKQNATFTADKSVLYFINGGSYA